jgi:heme oxygenase
MAADVCEQDYVLALQRFYLSFSAVERWMRTAPRNSSESVMPSCAEILASDLSRLQVDIPVVPAEQRLESLAAQNANHRLGVTYVCAGSSLGAVVVGRHLRAKLGIAMVPDGAFFDGTARVAPPAWRQFLVRLANVGDDQHSSVVDGAIEAFRLFQTVFAAPAFATAPEPSSRVSNAAKSG